MIFSSPASLTAGHLFSYSLDCLDAVHEHDQSNESDFVQVFPNPANRSLTIQAEAMQHVRIYDITGTMVYQATVKSGEEKIDISAFETGLYLVQVETAMGVATRRVTVIR